MPTSLIFIVSDDCLKLKIVSLIYQQSVVSFPSHSANWTSFLFFSFTCWWFSFLPLLPNSIFFFPVSWWFLFAVVVAICVGNSRCFVVWWLCAISDLGCDGVLGFGRFGLWFGVVIWEKRENITDNDTFFWFNFNIWLMQPN